MNIQDSGLMPDNLQYKPNSGLIFSINGKSSDIKVTNTDASKAKTKTTFNSGADSKALVMK